MKGTHRELSVAEDRAFEARHKKFQRVGWFFLMLLLLAALSGFLGAGGFAKSTAHAREFSLEYDRVLQRQTPSELRLLIHGQSTSGLFTVSLPAEYLEKVTIEKITPEPKEATLTSRGVTWSFAASTGQISSHIYFEISAKHSGPVQGDSHFGTESISFKQYVLP